MRVAFAAAAMAAALAAAPAMAATIVQYNSDDLELPLYGFDSRLGTLTGVTLGV